MQRDVHFESDPHAVVMTLPPLEGAAPSRIVIDDTNFLFTAHFKKSGPDLILTGDGGRKLVLAGYFSQEKRPDLVSPDGATMSADLVARLAGPDAPGKYAQAGAPAGAQVIGRAEIVGGIATVQHANGVVENLKAGDALLRGDVVMTGDGSTLTLSLNDGTAFNMGASGRMVLTELIYDFNSKSNSAFISLVKGTFTFVAGQVAHTGDMRVSTPVATMGIRGTTVGAYLDADIRGNIYQFVATLLDDPAGGSGRYEVLDPVTGAVLHTVRSTATQVSFTTAPNNQITVQELPKTAAIFQHELAVVQVLFPIFLANPANVQAGQPLPQPRNDTLTPPQDQPQPPAGIDPNILLQLSTFIPTITVEKATPASPASLLITPELTPNPTNSASISIAPVAGNNIVNLHRAQAGFVIAGSEFGADGTVTIKILDASGHIVGSYTTTAAGGGWSVNVAPAVALALADGTYVVQATASAASGGTATTATRIITVDETPPVAPGVALTADTGRSATDHITNNGALTLSGIETGALVEYSIDGGKTWSGSFTAVEGLNTVAVRQTDVAGNISGAATFSLTLDTAAPAAPGVALATDSGESATDHITNNGALTLSGIETGALVEYSIDGGKTWSSSFTPVAGTNTVAVRQTDVAGSVSAAATFSFTLDTVARRARNGQRPLRNRSHHQQRRPHPLGHRDRCAGRILDRRRQDLEQFVYARCGH